MCHAGQSRPRASAAGTAMRTPSDADNFSTRRESKRLGAVFEARACEYLQRQRLRLVARNVTCRGGEIDLVMRDEAGVLVFVEVRARAWRGYGGAMASVGHEKRRRIVQAAQYFLATRGAMNSVCRFDVVAFDGCEVVWVRDAFRADGL
ncbi:putative endonuclease [Trinickia symbiotica]|nr:putative endonuclease [Trinickia symbiotica]